MMNFPRCETMPQREGLDPPITPARLPRTGSAELHGLEG